MDELFNLDELINQRFFLSDYKLKNGKTVHNVFCALLPDDWSTEKAVEVMREAMSMYGKPVFIAEIFGVKDMKEATRAADDINWVFEHGAKILPIWMDDSLVRQCFDEIRRGDLT